MNDSEVTEKFLAGGKLAIERLVKRLRLTNGYLVISENGKIVKKFARDIRLDSDVEDNPNE